MTQVCVMGLGYIGLPTAAMLASRGCDVIGCDIDEAKVATIASGKPHFQEPDLQMLLQAALQTGRLQIQTTPEQADYFIIAVPTPFKEGGKPDLSYVENASALIAPYVRQGNTVILESTCPVGATQAVALQLQRARPDLRIAGFQQEGEIDVHVAHCPERVMPGQMVRELMFNDRIIGGLTPSCAASAGTLYNTFVTGQVTLTDCRTAEFVKLIENAYRDVNIAFANELSLIASALGIDVWEAISLANRHPRVDILKPGCGVGGHCIAVDPLFLVDAAPREARLIRTARDVNDSKPLWISERICKLSARFRDPVVAALGITYKADVDDMRESPAIRIVQHVAQQVSGRVLVVEPNARVLPDCLRDFNNISLVDLQTAREEADIMAFLVPHRQFRQLDRKSMLNKAVIDAIGLMA